MKELFYSHTEKLLFWIPGYYDNSYLIKDIIEMPFEAKNNVVSLLEAFSRDEAKEAIKAAITKPLNGAKIAS